MLPPRLGPAWPSSPGSPDQSPGFAFQLVKLAGSPAWRCPVPGPPCQAALSSLRAAVPSAPGLDSSPGVPLPRLDPPLTWGARPAGWAHPSRGLLRPSGCLEVCPSWRSKESARVLPPPWLSCVAIPDPAPAPGPRPAAAALPPSSAVACAPVSCTRPAWASRVTGGSWRPSVASGHSPCALPARWPACGPAHGVLCAASARLPSAFLLACQPWVPVLLTTVVLCPLPCIPLVPSLATLL